MAKPIATHWGYPIGTLAARGGVTVDTIRYYERVGVMPRPKRNAAGNRRYTHDDLRRLNFIRRGRELAFSLEALRDLLRLVDDRTCTCAEGRALALDHLADIRGKIGELQRLENMVAGIVARCTGERVPDCPLIDALSKPAPLAVP